MKTKSFAVVLFLLAAHAAQAQIVQRWVTRYNGPANAGDLGTAVAVDAANNVAVTGDSQNGSNYDYYTAKYIAADGTLIWGVRYNGPANNQDYARSIAMDSSGNVIVTGNSSNGTNDDYYTAKYASANGALLWEARYNGPGSGVDRANSMVVDSSGNVIVTGESANASGNLDYYTVKYAAANGAVVWSVRYNGPGNDSDGGAGVVVDSAGDVIVTGYSSNASLNTDYYTAKYAAANGALVWERRHNGPTNDYDNASSIAVDNSGNVAVTGEEKTGSGDSDFYTAKYAAGSGSILWERRFAGTAAGNDHPNSVAMDSAGNVIVGGSSSGGTTTDIYTAKYASANGAVLWEVLYNGTSGTTDTLSSVAVDSGGNVFIAGHSTQSHGGNNTDYYTAKYNAADGSLLWEKLYNGPGNGSDSMTSNGMLTSRHIALTTDGGAVVTGNSRDATTDYATLRYGPNPPAVTTSTSTGITATAATLNGTVNPNGLASTAQFQYGITTSHGTNVGLTLAPNDGTSAQNVSANLSGLSPGTLYYFRLTATSLAGTSNSDGTFTTLSVPEIAIEQPVGTNIPDGGTKGFGTVNVGSTSDLVFTVKNTGTADLTLSGTPRVAVSGTDAGIFTVTAQPATPITGPSGSTTFTVRFAPTSVGAKTAALSIANNDGDENPFDINLTGTGYLPPPTVTTSSASGITTTAATLNGTVNPNGTATTAQFQYGLTTGYGMNASVTLSPNDGSSAQNVSANLTGLTPGALYHYRLNATNSGGTSNTTDGTFFTTGPGSLDTTFGTNGIVTTPVGSGHEGAYDVVVQPDGKTVAVGFSHNGTNFDFALVRYNGDGSLDTAGFGAAGTTFNGTGKVFTDFGGDDYGYGVALQSDGKIVVTGSTAPGNVFIALARYNANGTLDTSFDGDGKLTTTINASTNTQARDVTVQSDGKIVVAGYCNTGSSNDFAVVRYHGLAGTGTPGSLDTSFGTGGAVTTGISGNTDNAARGVVIQPDGKIVLAGSTKSGVQYDFALVRYSSAGVLDSTFGSGGIQTTNINGSSDDYGLDVALQTDGKILAVGSTFSGGFGDTALLRYNTNGVLDTTFNSTGKVVVSLATDHDEGQALAVQGDGKILVAGYARSAPNSDFALSRFTSTGSLDTSFYGTGSVTTQVGSGNDNAYGIALRGDGAIVVAGFSSNGTNNDFALVRYLGLPLPAATTLAATSVTATTATLNATVNPNGHASTAAFQYGTSTSYGSTVGVTLSPTDGSSGQNVSANLTGLTPNTVYHARVVAMNANGVTYGGDVTFGIAPGALDVTFNTTGIVTTPIGSGDDNGQQVVVQPDGKSVVVAQTFNGSNYDFAVLRYNANGSLDTGFGTGGKVVTPVGTGDDYAFGIALQSDGKIVVCGKLWTAGGNDTAVVRYNTNGTLDTSFGGGDGIVTTNIIPGTHDEAYRVAIQPADQKIVVAGTALSGGTNYDFCAVRYLTNGDLDPSFDTDGMAVTTVSAGNDFVQGMALQPDGRIVVIGFSPDGAGFYDFSAVRFNSNGSLDSGFDGDGKHLIPVGTSHDYARDVAVQPDGRIVICGYSHITGDDHDFAMVRLMSGGALDTSFNTTGKVITPVGAGFDGAYGMTPQADGKIVLVGGVNSGGNTDFGVVRYNGNGTLDTTFNGSGKTITPIGAGNDSASDATMQADGGILVVGQTHNGSNLDIALVRYLGDPLPLLTLGAASPVAATTATLNATVNPNGLVTTAEFQYGQTTGYGSTASVTLSPNNGGSAQAVSSNLSGLTPGTLYHYRLTATNSAGTSTTADGTFTTLAPEIRLFAGANDAAPELTDGQVAVVDFGSTPLGTPVTRSFTVKNVGTADLHVSGLSLPAVYEYVGTAFPWTLVPNSTLTFQVRFLANTVHGTFSGPLSLANDDADEGPFDLTVNGIATGVVSVGGALDTGFNGIGKLTTPIGSGDDFVLSVALQSDGKVVVAGHSWNGSNWDFALVRYTAAGALDPSFGGGTGKVTTPIGSVDDYGQSVAVQSDGKIVVAGFSYNGSNHDFALVRYTATGALDPSFGGGTGKVTTPIGSGDDAGLSVAVQSDGKIVVAGYSWNGSNWDFALVRYTAAGALDTSFGGGTGKVTTAIGSGHDVGYSVAVQSDGKIVVAGHSYNGSNYDFALVRYTAAGALDTSFGGGIGKVTTPIGSVDDYGQSVAVQSDGKIVVAGSSLNGSNNDFALVRYTDTGALDPSFGGTGKVTTAIGSGHDAGFSVAVQSDGKIVVSGYSSNGSNWDFALLRYTAAGALDTSFGGGTGKVTTPIGSSDDVGRSVAVQSDGKIVVAGYFLNGSNYDFALVRYDGGSTSYTAPTVVTGAATTIATTSATLNGTVNPNGIITSAWFEYGLTTSYGQTTTSQPQGYGTSAIPVTANLTGLTSGTLYHYRIVAQNGETTANGADMTFTTLTPPTATTLAATSVTTTGVVLNGTVNANGSSTAVSFDYGLTTSYGTNVAGTPTPVTGSSATAVSATLTGLAPDTTYHFRVNGASSAGTTNGSDLTFTTLTVQQSWRQTYFGTTSNTGNAADSFDYDKDGLVNLLEWACNLNPTTASTLPFITTRNGAVFEFTYTRSVSAVNAGATFTVEWSDTLPGTSWSNVDVTEQILSDNGTVQQVKATVPAGSSGRRFVHLRVTASP